MLRFILYLTFLGLCWTFIDAKRCRKNSDCSSGYHCVKISWSRYRYCRRQVILIADGHYCRSDDTCISKQCTCNSCGRRQRNNKRCATDDNCASGYCGHRGGRSGCSGVCASKVPYGHACHRHGRYGSYQVTSSCSRGQCTCGYCGKKMPARYRCSTNNNCASGNCGGWFTVGCRGRCS